MILRVLFRLECYQSITQWRAMMLHRTCAVVATCLFAACAVALEPKDLAKVSIDGLAEETQKSAEPTDGMNLVWYIPIEFWDVTLRQDPTIDEASRADMIGSLEEIFILGMVRADISNFGAFSFHDENEVLKHLTVTFIDKEGMKRALQPAEKVDPDVRMLLNMMRPMFTGAMGPMGESFHMIVYNDRDEAGNRIVSPLRDGTLRVNLQTLGKEAGGTINFEFPLDSLYEPRICTNCAEPAHIRWNWCPFCGTELPRE